MIRRCRIPFSANNRKLSIQMDLICVAMMTSVMMIIGGVMLMVMKTMTMPEIMTVTMMMAVVLLVSNSSIALNI